MDFITDKNPTALYEVGIKAGDKLPDYVKEAHMLQEEDVSNLASAAFADRSNRLHPIHTKAATYMSAVYLAGAGKTDSAEFAAVKQAAAFYDIEEDIDFAISLIPAQIKSASAELLTEKYALNFSVEEDDSWQAYPINTDVEVTKAATEVIRDWMDDHIPSDWLFHAAQNIVKQAHSLGIQHNDIPQRIWDMGEERMVDFDHALEIAYSRQASRPAAGNDYVNVTKQASEGAITVDAALDQWMTLDTIHKVSHKNDYSPHEAFYAGMKISEVNKQAACNVFISDVLVPANEILKLARDEARVIKMSFRKEAAENIIGILNTLNEGSEKAAAETSLKISKLPEVQRKELLNLLLQVA
jgi:hypothetical protein